jgi:hypothetical protein
MGHRTEIDLTIDPPQPSVWDRIADLLSCAELSPRTSSTALAVLAYVSGSERAEEER